MKDRAHVLVVDDDDRHRTMLCTLLRDLGADVAQAENGEQALVALRSRQPCLMLLDMKMPVLDGMGTLRAMQAEDLVVPTVILTAHAELDAAVKAMKLGAADYLRKPIDIASLQALVDRYVVKASPGGDAPDLPAGIIIRSPMMLQVVRDLQRVAASEAPVLLFGETGTGKEVFANLVHRFSARAQGPLVPVNVAAIPQALVESELFGHVKGAFTGAQGTRDGYFDAASGGTLFLDEIGEMPDEIQPKLLRVLQEHRIARVGETTEHDIDFRLVSATHRDLEADVESGRFRQDLFYRVAVITLEIPPLRERPEDVLPLAEHFLSLEHERKRLSPSAQARLLGYEWPGNVRELHSAMLRAGALAAGTTIVPDHLPPNIQGATEAAPLDSEASQSLAEIERRAILDTLSRTDGNRSAAARILGISRRKLLYRLKEYGENP